MDPCCLQIVSESSNLVSQDVVFYQSGFQHCKVQKPTLVDLSKKGISEKGYWATHRIAGRAEEPGLVYAARANSHNHTKDLVV